MEELQDYLLYEMKFSTSKKKVSLRQSQPIEILEKKFGDQVKKVQTPKMPVMSKILIVNYIEDSEKISAEDQKLF